MYYIGMNSLVMFINRMENGKMKQHVLTKEETQEMFDRIPKDSLNKE